MKKHYLHRGLSGKQIIADDTHVFKEADNNVTKYSILRYLNQMDFQYAHKFLGINQENFEVYYFIDGNTYADYGYNDFKQTLEIIKVLQQLQITSLGYTRSTSKVIVHGHLSPLNVIFDNDWHPYKIIDWDNAHVGHRFEDFAYILWVWNKIFRKDIDDYTKISNMITCMEQFGIRQRDLFLLKQQVLASIQLRINLISKNRYIPNEKERGYIHLFKDAKVWFKKNWKPLVKEFVRNKKRRKLEIMNK